MYYHSLYSVWVAITNQDYKRVWLLVVRMSAFVSIYTKHCRNIAYTQTQGRDSVLSGGDSRGNGRCACAHFTFPLQRWSAGAFVGTSIGFEFVCRMDDIKQRIHTPNIRPLYGCRDWCMGEHSTWWSNSMAHSSLLWDIHMFSSTTYIMYYCIGFLHA